MTQKIILFISLLISSSLNCSQASSFRSLQCARVAQRATSSTITAMPSLLARAGLLKARPSLLTKMPKLYSIQKRTIVLDLLDSDKPFEDSTYSAAPNGRLAQLEKASTEVADPSNIPDADLIKEIYFAKISSKDCPHRYFTVDTQDDIANVTKHKYSVYSSGYRFICRDNYRLYTPIYTYDRGNESRPYENFLKTQNAINIRWFCFNFNKEHLIK